VREVGVRVAKRKREVRKIQAEIIKIITIIITKTKRNGDNLYFPTRV